MRPLFIVLDGPDGSGTTRQSERLAARLEKEGGNTVVLTAEPTSGPIGGQIRSIIHSDPLPSPEMVQLLFCADRADHVSSVILPALSAGKIVVCDRYAASTIAYGEAFGVDVSWLKSLNSKFIQPDIVLFTMPAFEVCLERIARREHQDAMEKNEVQRRVYDAYLRIAREDPSIISIDTGGNIDETAERIFEIVQKRLF